LPGVLHIKVDVSRPEFVSRVAECLCKCAVVLCGCRVVRKVARKIRNTRISIPAGAVEQLAYELVIRLEIRAKLQRMCAVRPGVVIYELKTVFTRLRAGISLRRSDIDSLRTRDGDGKRSRFLWPEI